MFKSHWAIAVLVYLIFFSWYTNLSGPLSEAEIQKYISKLNEINPTTSAEDIDNFTNFMRQDDGGDFYMVNYLDLNETPPFFKETGSDASSSDLMNFYMEYMYPAMLKRASHPVFFGDVSAKALDHIGAEESKEWDQVGIIRYRSRRDVMEISNNKIFSERHKFKSAALTKTIAIPVSSPLIVDLRVIVFMFLMILTLLIDKYRNRN